MKTTLAAIGLSLPPILLVFKEPDFGTALIYAAAVGAILLLACVPWSHLAALAATVGIVLTGVVWLLPAAGIDVLQPYQVDRLIGFLDPDVDPSGTTCNVNQSITAVGSGGLDGRGVSGATQMNLNYLPEHKTDFVFALAEQRGFLFRRFRPAPSLRAHRLAWIKVIALARNLFSAMVAGAIVAMFLFQVFVNVGMTIGIAPITGIPLPFVSFGGSLAHHNDVHGRPARGDPRARPSRRTVVAHRLAPPPPRPARRLQPPQGDPTAGRDFRPLVLAGAAEPAARIEAAFVEGGDEQGVRNLAGRTLTAYDVQGAEVLVYVIEGDAMTPEDERTLRLADRHDVEIVGVLSTAAAEPPEIAHVLATDLIVVRPGQEIRSRRSLSVSPTAWGQPHPRVGHAKQRFKRAVCQQIVSKFARQNGILGAAIFIPGADFPVLTLNQIRMQLRLAAAHGEEIDASAVELLGVAGRQASSSRARTPGADGLSRPRLGDHGRGRLRRHARARGGGPQVLRERRPEAGERGGRLLPCIPVLAFRQ